MATLRMLAPLWAVKASQSSTLRRRRGLSLARSPMTRSCTPLASSSSTSPPIVGPGVLDDVRERLLPQPVDGALQLGVDSLLSVRGPGQRELGLDLKSALLARPVG